VTTEGFYDHFGLEGRDSLPGIEELRAAGLLETRSAIAVLGAQAMAATAPRPDDEEADGDDDFDEEALARSVAGAALEDDESDDAEAATGPEPGRL
jgi:segregation and condensation protein B